MFFIVLISNGEIELGLVAGGWGPQGDICGTRTAAIERTGALDSAIEAPPGKVLLKQPPVPKHADACKRNQNHGARGLLVELLDFVRRLYIKIKPQDFLQLKKKLRRQTRK